MRVAIYSPHGRRVGAVTKGDVFAARESFTEPGVLVAFTRDQTGRSTTVRLYPEDWAALVDFVEKHEVLSERYKLRKD